MSKRFKNELRKQLDTIIGSGTYKTERVLVSPQSAEIELASGQKVINLCSNTIWDWPIIPK